PGVLPGPVMTAPLTAGPRTGIGSARRRKSSQGSSSTSGRRGGAPLDGGASYGLDLWPSSNSLSPRSATGGLDCRSFPLRSARVHVVGPTLKVYVEGIGVAGLLEIYSVGVAARHGPAVGSCLKRSALSSGLGALLTRFAGGLSTYLGVGPIRMLRGGRTDLP